MKQRIRVTLVAFTPMMRDIVRSIVERQNDMEVVGVFDRADQLFAETADGDVDVYLVGVKSDLPRTIYDRMLATHARPRVVGISSDGRRMLLCELSAVGALSADDLVETIRGGGPLGL